MGYSLGHFFLSMDKMATKMIGAAATAQPMLPRRLRGAHTPCSSPTDSTGVIPFLSVKEDHSLDLRCFAMEGVDSGGRGYLNERAATGACGLAALHAPPRAPLTDPPVVKKW